LRLRGRFANVLRYRAQHVHDVLGGKRPGKPLFQAGQQQTVALRERIVLGVQFAEEGFERFNKVLGYLLPDRLSRCSRRASIAGSIW
jgi:hypothetical protein